MSQTRRSFMAASVAGAAAFASESHEDAPVPTGATREDPIVLKDGAVVLLQGDSITDAGRDRGRQDLPNDVAMLGSGYAKLIAYHLLSRHADRNLKIYNRGISGHKVPDLDARWQKDTLDLKPDVLSILIGVNDIWHKLNGRYDGTVASYASGYETLLRRTRDALPEAALVVCEPFVLRCGAVHDGWFPEFDERRAAAAEAARAVGARFVPFQSMFDHAVEAGSTPQTWAGDGVHPSAQGAALMAMRWIGETGLA